MGVTAEVDRIAAAGLPSTDRTGWAQLAAAFPSADQLLDEIQVGDHPRQHCLQPLHRKIDKKPTLSLGSCCLLAWL